MRNGIPGHRDDKSDTPHRSRRLLTKAKERFGDKVRQQLADLRPLATRMLTWRPSGNEGGRPEFHADADPVLALEWVPQVVHD